jgi:serine/threonine-protein kinase
LDDTHRSVGVASLDMQPSLGMTSSFPQPGEVLDGKYRIEHLLGEGGMGAVAKATHLLRRAPVALKFMSLALLSLPDAIERFVNEGVAASQIDSDHVVKIFDVGRMPNGAPYLVMEYLDGCDLSDLLERQGQLIDPARAVHFALQMLRALQTAHAAGIIHRDMKPSNCFVIVKDGEPDFIKLVDFGISKVRAADDGQAVNLTRTNSALGTPLYMSPEQARSPRDVDHRTDLYSVGAILYEMLSGRTPYTAESGQYTEILYKIFTTDPEPLQTLRPDLPHGVAAVVHRALLRDREQRFGSAAEMAEALAPFADGRSAQVLARLPGARVRSGVLEAHSITPAAASSRAQPREAMARTFASGALEALRPPRVPTDVGVTREAALAGEPATRGRRIRTGIAVGVISIVVLTAAVGGVVLRARSSTPAKAVPDPSMSPAGIVQPSAPSPLVETTAPATLTTTPATSLEPPAAEVPRRPPARPPASGTIPSATNQSLLPKQLGDLKLH